MGPTWIFPVTARYCARLRDECTALQQALHSLNVTSHQIVTLSLTRVLVDKVESIQLLRWSLRAGMVPKE